jgi:hypothetical protein
MIYMKKRLALPKYDLDDLKDLQLYSVAREMVDLYPDSYDEVDKQFVELIGERPANELYSYGQREYLKEIIEMEGETWKQVYHESIGAEYIDLDEDYDYHYDAMKDARLERD